MKKFTLLVTAISCLCHFSKAQITITQADVPDIWSRATMAVDATGNFSPQAGSPTAQTWNYKALGNSQTNTYLFTSPSSTIYAPAFAASSNLADSLQYGSGYTFFSSTPTSFSGTGYGEFLNGFALSITLHPYFVQIPLPATYGTIDGGISKGDSAIAINYTPYDSGRAKVVIHYADTVDAFGTMMTPFGTQTVIRQKHYDLTIDTLWGHIAHSSWMVFRTTYNVNYIYRWYANNFTYYFATMQMDHTNTKDSLVQWFNDGNLGIDNISGSQHTTVYPNPCQTQITFNCAAPQAKQVSVFDMTGRELAAQEMNNGMVMMNTSAYPAGMYFYRISDMSGNVLDRGKFIVQ